MYLLVVLTILICALEVSCRSAGAPMAACSTLSPDQSQHGAPAQPASSLSFTLELNSFVMSSGGGYSYTPGGHYRSKSIISLHF